MLRAIASVATAAGRVAERIVVALGAERDHELGIQVGSKTRVSPREWRRSAGDVDDECRAGTDPGVDPEAEPAWLGEPGLCRVAWLHGWCPLHE
jgi:hypothetical protein